MSATDQHLPETAPKGMPLSVANKPWLLPPTLPILVMASFSLLQGVPNFFFTLALPAVLRSNGAGLDLVGLTYVVWLPFALKWLWSPLFDAPWVRPFGSRLTWLRALAVLLALIFALVGFFPPSGSIWPLIVLSMLSAFTAATVQVILAAWLMQQADSRDRAVANATGVAAMVLGAMLGAGVLLELLARLSWNIAIWSVAGLVLVLALPAWMVRNPSSEDWPTIIPLATGASRLIAWLGLVRRPDGPALGLAILGFGLASGADALVPALMIDKGFTPSQAGWLLGTVATGSVIPASLIVGWALRQWRLKPVMLCLYGAKACVLALLVLQSGLPGWATGALAVGDFCLAGALTVVTWQLFMAASDPAHAATDYGLLTSLDAALRLVGGLTAGHLAEQTGYAPVFAVAAAGAFLAAFCAPHLNAGKEGGRQ